MKNSKDIKDSKECYKIRKKFSELFHKVQQSMGKINRGIYNIKVSKILDIGFFGYYQPEVIIVKDSEDRCWIVPETDKLISRHDVGIGTKLEIKMIGKKTERIISEAVII